MSGTPPPGDGAQILSRSTLLWYAAPWTAFMAASMPINMWFGKYTTDTLLVPAAAVGTIVMIARLWDAVSDPLAGYLSDRTVSKLGRRRSWMWASALPMAATLFALWSPPSALDVGLTIVWLGFAYVAWETASTALLVPHAALGYELTTDYHERTRLFGWRHLTTVIGFATSLCILYLLRTSGEASPEAGREMASHLALGVGALLLATVWLAATRLPEPAHHQGRGPVHFRKAFVDVFRNPHARILLVVFAVESFGMGSIGFLTPYLMDDVLGRSDLLEFVLAGWMIPQFVFTPLWMRLSRRIGKKPLCLAGILIYAAGFLANWWLTPDRVWLVFAVVIVLGIGGGITAVVAPSIQADVIDYDEHRTGERKEGAYTAIWNLIRKSGGGVAAGFGGLALGVAGYDGNAPQQTAETQRMILVFVSLVPGLTYAFAAAYFSRFALNEVEHAGLRADLDERASRG